MISEDPLCPSFMKQDNCISFLQYETPNDFIVENQEPIQTEPVIIPQTKKTPKATCKPFRKNRKFTKEEDEKLKELVGIYGEGYWTKVAEKMPGRNRKQVRERYVNFVKKERSFSEFTAEEDSLILNFVQTKGRKWIVISNMLPGRTPIMIKNRYYAKLRHIAKLPK